eukprot:CAMPEP_0201875008 /NCGR_PEP_ID=MMETSP0902-20130614/7109_1 /ASSEMBLY_ACC=CAM_ASM_000551 /TAXON_ID=420261 /ORGANISM="Thalassiosira antarctica, Strain CCMP982" /LENGTH=636 /DNA_ID=CAMNT_0048401979 /DNA_START=47 /DNA_END=1957 /DNA_ORIENTATION=+
MNLARIFAVLASTISDTHASALRARKLDLTESVVQCQNGGTGMVSTAHPTATQAGADILAQGGTAVDAMIAVQAMLGLVEPEGSGMGGGSFAIYHNAETQETTTFDGREKAPSSSTGDRFSSFSSFVPAWQSGLSVGVPGTPLLLHNMHQAFGTMSMDILLTPSIDLATNGFPLTNRTYDLLVRLAGFLNQGSCEDRLFLRDPTAFEYFYDDVVNCTLKTPGSIMTNPDYAHTLQALINGGANAFYNGTIAEDIAAAVQEDLSTPGDMTVGDLADYTVVRRDPVCIDYQGHNICGMGPPSSGGLAVGQIMGLLEGFGVSPNPLEAANIHLFTQAGRLAFADRNQYVADADFVSVPSAGMLDKEYLADRASLIDVNQDMGTALPGTPPGMEVTTRQGADPRAKMTGTTHISIVDSYGNALSMTSSIEAPFGNGVMVGGFFLNNELTDFSFAPADKDGNPIANRVEGNKRPRSSMSPTIVLDGKTSMPRMLTGSPGGSRIIAFTAQSLWNLLGFDLDPQEAINLPHFMNNNGATELEDPTSAEGLTQYNATALLEELNTTYGHTQISISDGLTSGLAIIHITNTELIGGADPRRDGAIAPDDGAAGGCSKANGADKGNYGSRHYRISGFIYIISELIF